MRMFLRAGEQSARLRQSMLSCTPFSCCPLTHARVRYRDLKRESYGYELLQAIGFVYVSKAKHHLATNQTFFGVGGWLHNVQGKYHVFSET